MGIPARIDVAKILQLLPDCSLEPGSVWNGARNVRDFVERLSDLEALVGAQAPLLQIQQIIHQVRKCILAERIYSPKCASACRDRRIGHGHSSPGDWRLVRGAIIRQRMDTVNDGEVLSLRLI